METARKLQPHEKGYLVALIRKRESLLSSLGRVEGEIEYFGYGERDTDGNFRLKEME